MHVKTGAYVIGVVEAMVVAAEIIFFFAHGGGSLSGLIGTMLWTLAVVFLFLGLKQERARYLLLNLVMQILQLLIFITLIGVCIYFLVTSNLNNDHDALLLSSLGFVASVLGCCIEIWFFIIVLRCYRYLRHKTALDQVVVIQSGHVIDRRDLYAPPQYYAQEFALPIDTFHLPPPPSYAEVTKTEA
jgi:FlaA1/EpsC-like NDP-sugar epimerase